MIDVWSTGKATRIAGIFIWKKLFVVSENTQGLVANISAADSQNTTHALWSDQSCFFHWMAHPVKLTKLMVRGYEVSIWTPPDFVDDWGL